MPTRNLTDENATVSLTYGEDIIIVWVAKNGDPIWLNYSPDRQPRFCIIDTMTWAEVREEIADNIRNGWSPVKWPDDWAAWRKYA